MRTMTTHQKIDHQHDQGISLSGGNATPPDTSTYDQETRTRESHLSEKRLSASSFTVPIKLSELMNYSGQ